MKTSMPCLSNTDRAGLRAVRIIPFILLLMLAAAAAYPLAAQTSPQDSTTTQPQVTPPSGTDSTVSNSAQPTTASAVKPAPVTHSPARFVDLRAGSGYSRGVLAGGSVVLMLNRPLGNDTPVVRVNGVRGDSAVQIHGHQLLVREVLDSSIIVDIPSELPRGAYEVRIELERRDTIRQTIVLERPHILQVESFPRVLLISLIPIILLGVLLYLVSRNSKSPEGTRKLNMLQMLLLEPANMTYSLSRAQFILWTVALASSYVFLFVARGLVESIWTFPPLTGFAGTFLISLGTLLGAQATTSVKGAKGSGEVNPSLADLFVHGGVIALERVQQALWTLIAVGMFVYIVVKNYALSTQLPVIPDTLLYLMGISSAGYLTGKALRNAGPIIAQIAPLPNSTTLTITGSSLSNDALIWIDGARIDTPVTVAVPDADNPNQFAQSLQVAFPTTITSINQWYGAAHCVVVVNDDSQRAEWRSVPKIVSVTSAAGATAGTVALAIGTQYVDSSMKWQVTGIPPGPVPVATLDPTTPDQWLMTIPDTGQTQKFTTITVTDAAGHASTFAWQG